jgi:addiction module RelE/StbE family toxin
MRITFEPAARAELDDIFDWIAADNPRAATEMLARIKARIGRLASPTLAHMGRPGRDKGTRELVVPPYIIVYEVFDDRGEVVVLSIAHGARKRSTE